MMSFIPLSGVKRLGYALAFLSIPCAVNSIIGGIPAPAGKWGPYVRIYANGETCGPYFYYIIRLSWYTSVVKQIYIVQPTY